MTGWESAAIALGKAVVESALKIWMKDRKLASNPATSPVDLLSGRATNLIERRKAKRIFDQMIDVITIKITPILEIEYRNLAENEQNAAIIAVQGMFDKAALTDEDLFSQDLNAAYLDRYLRNQYPDVAKQSLLSEEGQALFDLLLRECCELLIQVTMTMPPFTSEAVVQLLRRETEIVRALNDVLERLPARPESRLRANFEVSYRRQVSNSLDRMELFGASLSDGVSRYPLSVAYISLSVSGSHTADASVRNLSSDATVRVEAALASASRVLIRGDAGSGKTTLLRWAAVRSALGDFDDTLSAWNNTIPFFVPLRRYVDKDLPTPREFVSNIGRHIADEMPQDWVHQQLRSGRAIILLDGVDELPAKQRGKVREWLRELLSEFPDSRYIVTSRSAAVSSDWLIQDDFIPLEIQPMTPGDIKAFIHQWHEAMRSITADNAIKEHLFLLENKLIQRVGAERHLHMLADAPLLCALICALHYDRRGQLPRSRMEVYEVALEMLLERRDAEREIGLVPDMSRIDKTILLQDIAYWLIRNGLTDESREKVISHISVKLASMPQITAPAEDVYRHLLERSGILREPIVGHVDFVHKTFQEYLAALELLSSNDVGLLIRNAHLDEWREVFVMAVGHAYTPTREELLTKLLARADSEPAYRDQLNLLAVSSLATSPELSSATRDAIRSRVRELLPPRNVTMAKILAAAGEFVMDLLAEARPSNAREVAATIRAAAIIGTEASFELIAGYRNDTRSTVTAELNRSWNHFDVERYARDVLSHAHIDMLRVTEQSQLPQLVHITNLKGLQIAVRGSIDLNPIAGLTGLTELDLNGMKVSTLAPLANLAQLKTIVLNGTEVSDLTPLSRLTELNGLYLDDTQVSDLAPLANLRKLRRLDLDDTQVSDLAPLANLTKLETLYLRGAQVSDLTPLASLTELNALHLNSTQVSDLTPLASLFNLKMLDLDDTKVSDLTPLANLSNLRTLHLTHAQVVDVAPLTGLTRLFALYLSHTQLVDLAPLAALTQLNTLRIRGAQVSDLTPLASLSNLRMLDLDDTQVSDLTPLANLIKLRTLEFSRTRVSDLTPLSKLTNLNAIFLGGTQVSDLTPLANLTNLRTLYLRGTQVSDMAPVANLPKLRTVIGHP